MNPLKPKLSWLIGFIVAIVLWLALAAPWIYTLWLDYIK